MVGLEIKIPLFFPAKNLNLLNLFLTILPTGLNPDRTFHENGRIIKYGSGRPASRAKVTDSLKSEINGSRTHHRSTGFSFLNHPILRRPFSMSFGGRVLPDPVNGSVIVPFLTSDHFGEVALKNESAVSNSLK
jgi:hypothetical protein